jgi:flavin-dependent dehydrogenase
VRLPDDLPVDTTRVWFRPQDTQYFYWLIPEGPDRGLLGLIGEEPRTARARLDSFLAEQRMVPLGYQAARIPAYEGWTRLHRRVGGGDVFVVGDAAGHVKVSTVGGVYTGFRGARAVADLVIGNGRSEFRSLRRELRRHLLVRRVLSRFSEEDYANLLALIGARARRVLSQLTRDDSSALLRSLVINEPRLVLLGLRGLLVRESKLQDSDGTRNRSSARNAPTATIQPISR